MSQSTVGRQAEQYKDREERSERLSLQESIFNNAVFFQTGQTLLKKHYIQEKHMQPKEVKLTHK